MRSPRSTSVPAPGTVRSASPSRTSSEESRSTFARRPRSSSSSIAWPWGRFLTVGTSTVPGPFDTSSTTVEPSSASSFALGSWSSTWSKSTSLRTRVSSTWKPARSSTARASTSWRPTTRGTSRVSAAVSALTAR
jgi:hypothetical protein